MNLKDLQLNGMKPVDPNAGYSCDQIIYLDFKGANDAAYNNDALNIHINNIDVEHSSLTEEQQLAVITDLNTQFAGTGVYFTTELPETAEYSTIYVGKTDDFKPYGNFLGLAETIDTGNQIKTDNAFVFTNPVRTTKEISSTIAHEAGHLLGFQHSAETGGNQAIASYADSPITLQIVNNFSRRTAYYSNNYSDADVWLYSVGTSNTLSYTDTSGNTQIVQDGSAFQLSTVQNGTFTIADGGSGARFFAALGATNPFGAAAPGVFDTNIPYSLIEWTVVGSVTDNIDVTYEDTFSFPTNLTVKDSNNNVTGQSTFILGTTAERVVNALIDALPSGPVGPADPMPASGDMGWGPLVPTVSGQPEANRVIGSSKYWQSATYTNPPDQQLLGSCYYYAPSFNDYLGYLQSAETYLFKNQPYPPNQPKQKDKPDPVPVKGWYIDYSGNNGYSFYLSVTGTDGNYGLQVHDIYVNTTSGPSEVPTSPWNPYNTQWTYIDGTINIAANGATFPVTVTPAAGKPYTYDATGNWTDLTIYSGASLINGDFASGPVITGTGDFAPGGAHSNLNSTILASISASIATGLLGNSFYMNAINGGQTGSPAATMYWFNELERSQYSTYLFDAGWAAGQNFYDPYWKTMADCTGMQGYLSPFNDRWQNISPDFNLGADYSITWELGIPRKGKADFIGDGKSDILFTGDNGTRIGYYADGLPTGWTDLGDVSPGWAVAASADINGNGKDDILFVHENTIGYYADGLQSGWTDLGSFTSGWAVAGCADFDGNGKADILFNNDNLNLLGYYSDGQAAKWTQLGGYAAGWAVAGCADFDGNGKSDILFTNSKLNSMGYYADGLPTGWKDLGSFTSGWSVAGCGDFDGNGKSDILFTNSSLNAMGYYADGLPTGWKDLGTYASGWAVQYCADFDGNGNDDILFANNNLVGYFADGQPSGWKQVGSYSTGWQVAAI